jgi:uncharacterized protein YjbJ (UPF0337 family)
MKNIVGKLTSSVSLTGSLIMGGKTDEVKGRVKEAAGALTNNKKLKREGKMDQTKGKVKQVVDKAAKKTKQAIDRVTGDK